MLIKLAIYLFLATQVHAGVIRDNNNIDSDSSENWTEETPPAYLKYFNTRKLLEKLDAYNLTCSDFDMIGGDIISHNVARRIFGSLLSKGVLMIARQEIRAALNFGPLPSIKSFNKTEPSEEELASAPTLEAYYNLKESRPPLFETESDYNRDLVDANMPPAIAFLDKRFPSIRKLFRRKIREVLRSNNGKMNRENIDIWIDGMAVVHFNIVGVIYPDVYGLEC